MRTPLSCGEPPKQPDPPVQPDPVDIFDNEEEYVGVLDEHMYILIPPSQPSMNAQTDSSMPTNDANENDAAKGAVTPEAEVLMQILMR